MANKHKRKQRPGGKYLLFKDEPQMTHREGCILLVVDVLKWPSWYTPTMQELQETADEISDTLHLGGYFSYEIGRAFYRGCLELKLRHERIVDPQYIPAEWYPPEYAPAVPEAEGQEDDFSTVERPEGPPPDTLQEKKVYAAE